jgi:hypothetical protein
MIQTLSVKVPMIKIGRGRATILLIGATTIAVVSVGIWLIAGRSSCNPNESDQALLAAYQADAAYQVVPIGGVRLSEIVRFGVCEQGAYHVPREDRPSRVIVSTELIYRVPGFVTTRELYSSVGSAIEGFDWMLAWHSERDVKGGQITFCKVVHGVVSGLSLSPWSEPDGKFRLGVLIYSPVVLPSKLTPETVDCPTASSTDTGFA